jgi:hypothetical protein
MGALRAFLQARNGTRPMLARLNLAVARIVGALRARIVRSRVEFEPDPFSMEMPFLNDSWPLDRATTREK